VESIDLIGWLALWMAGAVIIVATQLRTNGMVAGLMLAYLINLGTIHWLGAAIYLFPWYANYSPGVVESGFRQSVWAIIGLAAGSAVVAPWLLPRARRVRSNISPGAPASREVVVAYVGVGLLFSLVLMPLIGGVPTLTAILSAGRSLIATGLGVACWEAWRKRSRALVAWVAAALCLPFLTIITEGFLGLGATTAVSVGALLAMFYRPRWKLVLIGLILGYLGLSFYVAYMRDRDDIREVVWGGQNLVNRGEQLYVTVSTSEWFDPYDNNQLSEIDNRLNQNYLVGLVVDFLASRPADYARGETLWGAVIALIPRALWADKPVAAGSGDLVTRYTGVEFAEGTSVGIGQVMEFYVNWGTLGVVLGFGVLGLLLSIIDSTAGRKLSAGDWLGFALWYLPGLALLQVGGSLVEVTASSAASLVAALVVNQLLFRRARIGERPESRVTAR
jgi:hypothetical protein